MGVMAPLDEFAPLAHEAVMANLTQDPAAWAATELALGDLSREQLKSLVAVVANLAATFLRVLGDEIDEGPAALATFFAGADPRLRPFGGLGGDDG